MSQKRKSNGLGAKDHEKRVKDDRNLASEASPPVPHVVCICERWGDGIRSVLGPFQDRTRAEKFADTINGDSLMMTVAIARENLEKFLPEHTCCTDHLTRVNMNELLRKIDSSVDLSIEHTTARSIELTGRERISDISEDCETTAMVTVKGLWHKIIPHSRATYVRSPDVASKISELIENSVAIREGGETWDDDGNELNDSNFSEHCGEYRDIVTDMTKGTTVKDESDERCDGTVMKTLIPPSAVLDYKLPEVIGESEANRNCAKCEGLDSHVLLISKTGEGFPIEAAVGPIYGRSKAAEYSEKLSKDPILLLRALTGDKFRSVIEDYVEEAEEEEEDGSVVEYLEADELVRDLKNNMVPGVDDFSDYGVVSQKMITVRGSPTYGANLAGKYVIVATTSTEEDGDTQEIRAAGFLDEYQAKRTKEMVDIGSWLLGPTDGEKDVHFRRFKEECYLPDFHLILGLLEGHEPCHHGTDVRLLSPTDPSDAFDRPLPPIKGPKSE